MKYSEISRHGINRMRRQRLISSIKYSMISASLFIILLLAYLKFTGVIEL